MNAIHDKARALEALIVECRGALVAFSGGVDSSYLLSVTAAVLGPSNVLAVTIESPLFPPAETNTACKIAKTLGVEHLLVRSDDLAREEFRRNPPDRCYHCKKNIFTRMRDVAAARGIPCVFEASNLDDTRDYRPGMAAVRELGIRSPLIEARLTKDEIRELSRERDLPTWSKPALACLATRIPYGEPVTREKCDRVRLAEEFIRSVGFTACRCRHHGNMVRIEVPSGEIDRLLDEPTRRRIVEHLKKLGFTYIGIDLEGYRPGSMNETLDM